MWRRVKMVLALNCTITSFSCWSLWTVCAWRPRVVQVPVQVCWTRCAHRQPLMQLWMRWTRNMNCRDAISTIRSMILPPVTSTHLSQHSMYAIAHSILYLLCTRPVDRTGGVVYQVVCLLLHTCMPRWRNSQTKSFSSGTSEGGEPRRNCLNQWLLKQIEWWIYSVCCN